MAVIALTSLAGAPGVSTTAVGLALNWPRHVVVADIDPHPNQSVLAGYLHGTSAGRRGLGEMAQAYREQRMADAALVHHLIPLDTREDRTCHYLPGFSYPAAPRLFEPYWSLLVADLAALGEDRVDVLADCGRLGVDGLPEAIAQTITTTVVVTHSDLPSLASGRLCLPNLGGMAQRASCLVVGPGRPYSTREIGQAFELGVAGEIPWAPREAAVISYGQKQTKSFRDSAWWRSVAVLAASLHAHVHPAPTRRVVIR